MFSDNLKSVDAVRAVIEYSKGKMNPIVEGLGTWITNDVGVAPLDMVIKLTGIITSGKTIYAIKLSDSKSKHTGDPETIKLYKTILGI
jgi:nicotinate phosphoribosyltransferase